MTTAIPTSPVVWTGQQTDPLDTIPAEHRDLLRDEWVPAIVASDLLGYRRKLAGQHEEASGAVSRMCLRYRARMATGQPRDLAEYRPLANELVARKGPLPSGGYGWLVDSRWLLCRMYPQLRQPW
jgi:hypothetical protein